ncbi:MAG: putative ABC transporter permease, partial [Bacteroidales bacterium]|nr:putative ABC transporter permease [Bacteroidales bacterium]
MEEHSLSTYIIVFFIFSFLGYISEVLYCSIGERRFINRGFLKGPIIPIYGFGGLVILLFLSPLKDLKLGYLYIFLSSMAVA